MFKKIISGLLVFCFINFTFLPAFAEGEEYDSGNIINAKFKTELNVNKASKGQVVQFVSTQNYNVNGFVIPEGTIFNGEVKSFKKGRFGYRRAKAVVAIKQIILPSGETHKIKAYTKKHVMKGSALGNVGKGIVTFPAAVVVGAVGVVVIVVEAVSIAGIIAIGPTTYGFGRAMGGLTHGINCKKHAGDEIQLKIKSL